MHQSTITINVSMDENKIPERIDWKASGSTADEPQLSKAMMLAFWDGAEKTALRIDLWTRDMMVDEMTDFFYQAMVTMADTYGRATSHGDLAASMKDFAKEFYRKFREKQEQQQ